jgi:hypothetical protein
MNARSAVNTRTRSATSDIKPTVLIGGATLSCTCAHSPRSPFARRAHWAKVTYDDAGFVPAVDLLSRETQSFLAKNRETLTATVAPANVDLFGLAGYRVIAKPSCDQQCLIMEAVLHWAQPVSA